MSQPTSNSHATASDASSYPVAYQIPWSKELPCTARGNETSLTPGADCLVSVDKSQSSPSSATAQARSSTLAPTRSQPAPQTERSSRDYEILRSVAALRIVTAVQLQRLHYPGDLHASLLTAVRSSRRTFERLTRAGYLARLERRVGGARSGSASYCYVLASKGLEALGYPRSGRREPSLPFAEHVLATAELVTDVIEATWKAEDLTLLTIQTETDCWRSFTGLAGAKDIVKPDLFLVLMLGADDQQSEQPNDELHWFIELDRGTEHRSAIQKKLLAYERYYRSGHRPSSSDIFPRVLWSVTAGANTRARVDQLQSWIESTKNITKALFVVREFEDSLSELKGEYL
jgi:hypothetical protein